MTPAAFLLFAQGLSALMGAIPAVEEIFVRVRDLVNAAFRAKLITFEQQAALFDHVEEVCAARLRGEVPPAWKVEPDPS